MVKVSLGVRVKVAGGSPHERKEVWQTAAYIGGRSRMWRWGEWG